MAEVSKITVGKIRDAHGLKGELFVILFSGEAAWMDKLETFYLVKKELVEGKLIDVTSPFKVKRIKKHKVGLLVLTEEISDRTPAEKLRGSLFQIPESLLISKPGETIFLREIENFVVYSGDEFLGNVAGFSSNGAQDLLNLVSAKGEFDVPFVAPFIKVFIES